MTGDMRSLIRIVIIIRTTFLTEEKEERIKDIQIRDLETIIIATLLERRWRLISRMLTK